VNDAPRRNLSLMLVLVVLPALIVGLGAVAGYLKWQDGSRREALKAAETSVAVARDTTVAILSYNPDTVERDLNAARERLTGSFLDSYTKLVNEVVIPGAKEKKISAAATVPAAASVSATPSQAVALVFVNQTTTIGEDAPTNTASSVKVTLDRVDGRWLVSGFDPV
jgi:Mce-associated membrane protein